MPAERIRVGFGALDEYAQQLQRTYADMVNQIEELDGAMAVLLPTWDGMAQQNFLQCQTDWKTAEHNVGLIVQRLSAKVNESNEQYRATEQQNAASFTF